jgi:hypothetical protein
MNHSSSITAELGGTSVLAAVSGESVDPLGSLIWTALLPVACRARLWSVWLELFAIFGTLEHAFIRARRYKDIDLNQHSGSALDRRRHATP